MDCIGGKSLPFHTANDLFQGNYTLLATERHASKLCPRQNLQDISEIVGWGSQLLMSKLSHAYSLGWWQNSSPGKSFNRLGLGWKAKFFPRDEFPLTQGLWSLSNITISTFWSVTQKYRTVKTHPHPIKKVGKCLRGTPWDCRLLWLMVLVSCQQLVRKKREQTIAHYLCHQG